MDYDDSGSCDNHHITQSANGKHCREEYYEGGENSYGSAPAPNIPLGLDALYRSCQRLYLDQPNPLQVTAVLKYWLGGPDPLDYISMYRNKGCADVNVPPHWHYISFGLSDLHGDGRVHEPATPDQPSGFGFELTMRVRKGTDDKVPPTWPATVMQALAKYVFQSETTLCVGDHVSWHSALDGSESRIQHMLLEEDPELELQKTPYGTVRFIQVVGVTQEELEAAQHWNGNGVLNIMKRFSETGGLYLVSNMRREETIFEIDPRVCDEIEEGIEREGSNLSGVSASISWGLVGQEDLAACQQIHLPRVPLPCFDCERSSDSGRPLTPVDSQQIKRGLVGSSYPQSKEDNPSRLCETEDDTCDMHIHKLPSLHIKVNLEAGSLLPLAVRGRLKHGRHFTYKSLVGVGAVTFLTPSVTGAFVSIDSPYVTKGAWLQVLIPTDMLSKMYNDLAILNTPEMVTPPLNFSWPERNLRITITEDMR